MKFKREVQRAPRKFFSPIDTIHRCTSSGGNNSYVHGTLTLSRLRSSWEAALIKARCVSPCEKLPNASPVVAISSENNPTWFAYSSILSKMSRPSSTRPARASASAYQNEHALQPPSIPGSPSRTDLRV